MENQWKYIIEPGKKRFELKFREVWQFRDLIFLFVRRDFVSKYKQTILGPVWAIVNPLLTTVVFTVVFGNFAKLPTMDNVPSGDVIVPSFLFYMIGNILWGFFSGTVKEASGTFLKNARIMGKVYYPRLISPIASAFSGLLTLLIRMLLFVVLLFIFIINGSAAVRPSLMLLLFPLLILQLMLLGLGTGLAISAITTKYRDMMMVIEFGLQLWLYITPVAYGLQLVPEKWVWLYMLNPISSIITTARYICFGEGYFQPGYFALCWILSAFVFFAGLFLFNRAEKSFIDTI